MNKLRIVCSGREVLFGDLPDEDHGELNAPGRVGRDQLHRGLADVDGLAAILLEEFYGHFQLPERLGDAAQMEWLAEERDMRLALTAERTMRDLALGDYRAVRDNVAGTSVREAGFGDGGRLYYVEAQGKLSVATDRWRIRRTRI